MEGGGGDREAELEAQKAWYVCDSSFEIEFCFASEIFYSDILLLCACASGINLNMHAGYKGS